MAFPWIALAMGASTLLDAMLSNKKYPPELEALLKSMSMQGNQLMNGPGLSETDIAALFGKDYENVRAQGKNVSEQTTSALSGMGMSKTGAAVKASQQNYWENENLVTNAIRDMVIAKKNAKLQDMQLATQMAGTATGAEVNRVEKGPDLTSLVGLMALMGIGTGEGGAGKALALGPKVNPLVDSFGILGGAGKAVNPLSDPLNIIGLQTGGDPLSALSSWFTNYAGKPANAPGLSMFGW